MLLQGRISIDEKNLPRRERPVTKKTVQFAGISDRTVKIKRIPGKATAGTQLELHPTGELNLPSDTLDHTIRKNKSLLPRDVPAVILGRDKLLCGGAPQLGRFYKRID